MYTCKYLSIYTYMFVCVLYIYIYSNFEIELYIYNRNYTSTYITEVCQQVFIFNEEAQ